MAQHSARHLLLTVRLAAKTTSPWAGEVGLMSFRFGTVQPGDSLPGLDAGTVDLQSFLVNDASTTSTTTHLNKVQNWAGDSGGSGVDITDGDQDALAELAWGYVNTVKAYISPEYTLQDIRLYPISDAGVMAATAPCMYTPIAALAGTSAAGNAPQLAVVTSTVTSVNGRRGRGRWYLGPIGTTLTTATGLLNTTPITTILGGGKSFFDGVRAIGSVASSRYYPIVWHRGSTQGAVIRALRIGDEIDTQQRRRRQRPEVYTASALA